MSPWQPRRPVPTPAHTGGATSSSGSRSRQRAKPVGGQQIHPQDVLLGRHPGAQAFPALGGAAPAHQQPGLPVRVAEDLDVTTAATTTLRPRPGRGHDRPASRTPNRYANSQPDARPPDRRTRPGADEEARKTPRRSATWGQAAPTRLTPARALEAGFLGGVFSVRALARRGGDARLLGDPGRIG